MENLERNNIMYHALNQERETVDDALREAGREDLVGKPFRKILAAVCRPDQLAFIDRAREAGYSVYPYTGRFMYGRFCPAYTAGSPTENVTGLKNVRWDNMGLDYVLYLP